MNNWLILKEKIMEGEYGFHVINIPFRVENHWQKNEEILLRAAKEVCSPYIEDARKKMKRLASKYSLETPSVEPKIHVQIVDPDKATLILRVPTPSRQRGRLEQEISRKYLTYLQEERERGETSPEDNDSA